MSEFDLRPNRNIYRETLVYRTLLAILAISAYSHTVLAEACDTAQTTQSHCVVLELGESQGVWFRLDAAERLRDSFLRLPDETARADAAEELAATREQQYQIMQHAYALETSRAAALETARAADAATIAALRSAAESHWYQSPLLWYGLGICTIMAAGGIYAARH